jgi:phosphatidylserine/phosphatidylglycerophosphate/cardiolipin synthase-like enzyme
VSIESAVADVLERLSDGQLEALAAACDPLAVPTGGLGRVVAGAPPGTAEAVANLTAGWAVSPGLTGQGVALALRIGLRARRDADARRSRPVWTGPGATGEQRLTAAVLHELIAGALKRILLVSYAAYTIPEVATDLEAAVARGCQVDVVFETTQDSEGKYAGPSRPFGAVPGISRWRWLADKRTDDAVLHAKLLVIDGQRALVSSANLTARALHRNLEAGVLTNDAHLAAQLEDHLRRLMSAGVLTRDAEG